MEAILAWMTVMAAGLRLIQMAAPALANIFRRLSGAIMGKPEHAVTEQDATQWLGAVERGLSLMPEVWAQSQTADFHLGSIDPKAEKLRKMLYAGQILATKLAARDGTLLTDDQGHTIAQTWFSGERAVDPSFGNDVPILKPGDNP